MSIKFTIPDTIQKDQDFDLRFISPIQLLFTSINDRDQDTLTALLPCEEDQYKFIVKELKNEDGDPYGEGVNATSLKEFYEKRLPLSVTHFERIEPDLALICTRSADPESETIGDVGYFVKLEEKSGVITQIGLAGWMYVTNFCQQWTKHMDAQRANGL